MNTKHTKLWLAVSAAVFLMSMPLVSSAVGVVDAGIIVKQTPHVDCKFSCSEATNKTACVLECEKGHNKPSSEESAVAL